MRKAIFASLVMLSLFGRSTIAYAQQETFPAITRAIMDKYSKALLAGDNESWISLWDDEAVQMPDNALMIEGKQNIRTTNAYNLKVITWEVFDIEITKTYVDSNIGTVYGNFKYAYKYKSGTRIERYGKYLDVLRKQSDGTWKILLDCSNLNSPG